jgi:hypothetical protein
LPSDWPIFVEEKLIRPDSILIPGDSQAPLETPSKPLPKPKVLDLKMCKSQKRNESRAARLPVMLMSSELHNWLLLMDLKGEKSSFKIHAIGFCAHAL